MTEQRYEIDAQGYVVYEKIELPRIGDVVVIDGPRIESLLEYSTSNPTGAYPNKMWKRRNPDTGGWLVCEYVENPTNHMLLDTRVSWAVSPLLIGEIAEGVLWWIGR